MFKSLFLFLFLSVSTILGETVEKQIYPFAIDLQTAVVLSYVTDGESPAMMITIVGNNLAGIKEVTWTKKSYTLSKSIVLFQDMPNLGKQVIRVRLEPKEFDQIFFNNAREEITMTVDKDYVIPFTAREIIYQLRDDFVDLLKLPIRWNI